MNFFKEIYFEEQVFFGQECLYHCLSSRSEIQYNSGLMQQRVETLLCTIREAQGLLLQKKKKKSKHRMYDRERPPGSVAPQYPSVYLTRHNSTSLSENSIFFFSLHGGFRLLGKSFPLKAREHPKEKACAVREFVQGELEKAWLSKCDCEYPDNVQACFCVSSSLRTVMRVFRVGRCGRLNDMKPFLLCVESELLASGGAFF